MQTSFTNDEGLLAELEKDDNYGELNLGGGHEDKGPSDNFLQKRHIINDAGEACFKTVRVTGCIYVTCPIPVTTVEVTSDISVRVDGKGSIKEKIALKEETVQHIWSGESKDIWVKASAKNSPRNDVLYCRPRKSVMEHGEEGGTRVVEVVVQQVGEFGPAGARSRCFFAPFGVMKNSKEPTGIWISTKYYKKAMVPKVVSLGHDEKETRDALKDLLNSGQDEEEDEEEDEKKAVQATELNQRAPMVPQFPNQQVMRNPFYYSVWFFPDFK